MTPIKPIAVVDANVLITMMTCLDLALHSERPGWSVDGASAHADRVKARQALILSWHLHELGAITISLWEPLRIIMTKVSAEDGGDPITQFTVIWIQYVRERLIPNWTIGDPALETGVPPFTEENLKKEVEKLWAGEPTSHGADQAHVDKAKEYGVPLITFEGLRDDGSIDPKSGIRLKATAAGISVMTPAEFYAGRNERLTCALFFNAYRDRANAYVRQTSNPEPIARAIERFEAYYRHILFGVVAGRNEPVPVTF